MLVGVIVMVKVDKYEYPEGLYYWAKGRSWAKLEPDGRVRIGLTDYGQSLAGRILFYRSKPKGSTVEQGKPVGSLESAKWTGPLESPVSGTIDEVNEELRRKPSLINEDPYGRGWVAIVKPTRLEEELKKLLTGDAAISWAKEDVAKAGKK